VLSFADAAAWERNEREGGINHRQVRTLGMRAAPEKSGTADRLVQRRPIERNNAIEAHQEGGALQIAEIQIVR